MILNYKDKKPQIDKSCYISTNATIIGDVHMEKGATVWFHSVIRGDKDQIIIGEEVIYKTIVHCIQTLITFYELENM